MQILLYLIRAHRRKIAHISENVTSENQKMADIDGMVEKLSVFADEIGTMISALF